MSSSKLGWSREDFDKENSAEVESDYDVTVRRAGYSSWNVTPNSENAKKLLGSGTYCYELTEWKKINKDLLRYGYSIEVI